MCGYNNNNSEVRIAWLLIVGERGFLLGKIEYGNSVSDWTDYGIAVRSEYDVSSVVNGSAKIGKLLKTKKENVKCNFLF